MDSNDLASQNQEIIYYHGIAMHFGMHAIAATVDKYSYMHRIGSILVLITIRYSIGSI